MEFFIACAPEDHPVIPGAGGFRKARWTRADVVSGRGAADLCAGLVVERGIAEVFPDDLDADVVLFFSIPGLSQR
jgi:hypothetical protein